MCTCRRRTDTNRRARRRRGLFGIAAVVGVIALALMGASGGTAHAQAVSAPAVLVRPTQLDLGAGPQELELWVEDATELEQFQLTLTFDSELVLVTATDYGDFLTSTGGTAILKTRFPETGQVSLSGTIALAEDQTYPSGGGVIAIVTLAPLAMGDASPLTLSDVALNGAEGEVPVDQLVGGTVVVSLEPPEAVVAEAVAQATTMAASTGGATSMVPAMPDVSKYGSQIVWLGLLLLSITVVAIGWLVGRRPKDRDSDERLYPGGPSYRP